MGRHCARDLSPPLGGMVPVNRPLPPFTQSPFATWRVVAEQGVVALRSRGLGQKLAGRGTPSTPQSRFAPLGLSLLLSVTAWGFCAGPLRVAAQSSSSLQHTRGEGVDEGSQSSADGSQKQSPPTRSADAFEVRAVVDAAPMPATNELDASASGTSVDISDPVAAERTVTEALFEVPGAHVVQTGHRSSFSAVTLRGTELGHTTVLLGDTPLSSPDTGAFDFSLIPLEAFERLEVYRGGAPAYLNAGAIGGVVRLIPAQGNDDHVTVRASGGSFHTYSLTANAALSSDDARIYTSVGADRSCGCFPFTNDGGTGLSSDDDREERRRNADHRGAHGFVLVNHALARDTELTFVGLGTIREAGAPGAGAAFALQARQKDARAMGSLSLKQRLGHTRVAATVGAGTHRRRFDDRFGEIGLGREISDDRTSFVHARLALEARIAPFLNGTMVTQSDWLTFAPQNELGPSAPSSQRQTSSATGELMFHGQHQGMRWAVRPSVRVEHSDTESLALEYGKQRDYGQQRTDPTLRVGAVFSPIAFVSVVSSAFTGHRLPSVLELFGDRNTLIANPELTPEHGQGYDVGVIASTPGWESVEGLVEVRAFRLRIEDLIRYRATSQYQAVAENVREASLEGIEAGGNVTFLRTVRASGNVTLLETDNGRGQALNWRPQLEARGQLELLLGPFLPIDRVHAFVEGVYRSTFFHDAANLVEMPERAWVNLGVRVRAWSGIGINLTLRDAFDARGQDYVGYPLPGRRFTATAEYTYSF